MAEISVERSSEPPTPIRKSKPRKTPRPSQQWVEVDTDEEEMKEPRHRGVMRGLDERQILQPATLTQEQPIEISDDDGEGDNEDHDENHNKQQNPLRHTHITRASQYGRQSDTYEKYNQKLHPMDIVTRPAHAAKQRPSGSRFLSVSATLTDDRATSEGSSPSSPKDGETDEESIPSSAKDSERDSDVEDSEVEIVSIKRQPDPQATRRSKRSSASKFVNYSAKHHPNDDSIIGHKHKARQLRRDLADLRPTQKAKKRRSADEKTSSTRKRQRRRSRREHASTSRESSETGRATAAPEEEVRDIVSGAWREKDCPAPVDSEAANNTFAEILDSEDGNEPDEETTRLLEVLANEALTTDDHQHSSESERHEITDLPSQDQGIIHLSLDYPTPPTSFEQTAAQEHSHSHSDTLGLGAAQVRKASDSSRTFRASQATQMSLVDYSSD